MFKTKWVNETGGEWFGSDYNDITDAELGAQFYFADNGEDVEGDIVQVWEFDENGVVVGIGAVAEFCNTDFA